MLHRVDKVKTNFPAQYKPNLICNSGQLSECNQSHIVYCSALIESKEVISYIPYHEDIPDDDDPKEQCFIANVMLANLKKDKEIEEDN